MAVNLSSVFRLCRAAGPSHARARRRRQDRQRRLAALVPGRRHRARLRRGQGRRRAAHQGARQRVGVARHQRERDRARLHGDRQHDRAPRRRHTRCGRSRERIPAGRWGTPRGPRRRGRLSGVAAPPTTSTATCSSWTAAGWGADRRPWLQRIDTRPFRRSRSHRAGRCVGFFARFVGPAALTAAGMIGAGAVATRLLAGAWFGFDLLWVALYVIPMVIVTLDSASRVGMPLRRPRHARHGARATSAPGWRGRSSCRRRLRERRRQHEPDVGDGRGRVRRARACCRRPSATVGLVSLITMALTGVDRRRWRCSAATSASRRS